MRRMNLNHLKPSLQRAPRRIRKSLHNSPDSAFIQLRRHCVFAVERNRARRNRLPAAVRFLQSLPPPSTERACCPSALRAPVASPRTAPWPRKNRVIRASGSMCSSFQIPKSSGLIRPSGNTADASVKTSAAPPTAREPRCTRCQSVAKPSGLEYWHIGRDSNPVAKSDVANFQCVQ